VCSPIPSRAVVDTNYISRVSRAQLRSSSPESSPDAEAVEELKARLDNLIGLPSDNVQFQEFASSMVENATDVVEDEHAFRLFSSGEPQSIRVQSPSTDGDDADFTFAPRPLSYYFIAHDQSRRAQEYLECSVSGEDIIKLSQIPRPGLQLPWKMIHAEPGPSLLEGLKSLKPTTIPNKKKCRPGKKYRIALRKRATAKQALEEQLKKAALEKEAHLREKKTKENRKKQLKKRAKDRAKKAELVTHQEQA
jgi:hypothetical protein